MLNRIINVLEEILEDLTKIVFEVSEDQITKLIEESFNMYYRVAKLKELSGAKLAFVDAGIYPLDLDVATVLYIQLGSMIRDVNGSLKSINSLKGLEKYPALERILLSVTRKRTLSEGAVKYSFNIELRTPENNSLLLGNNVEAKRISRELTSALEILGLTTEYKRSSLYRKLSKYIEGLLEIAYGIKLVEEGSLNRAIVDGTLVRWMQPRKMKERYEIDVDGLDVLSIILGEKPSKIREYCLDRLVGLAKTTKFTTISRAMKLFENKIKRERYYELYTLVNELNLNSLKLMFALAENEGWSDKNRVPRETIESIIRKFNTKVFPVHELWVSRFPLTMDGTHVMVLDVFAEKPTIGYVRKAGARVLQTFPEFARELNSRINKIVKEVFYVKSPLPGRPPSGLMEIDENVRINEDLRRIFKSHMVTAAIKCSRQNAVSLKVLLQIIAGSTRLRFGYGV